MPLQQAWSTVSCLQLDCIMKNCLATVASLVLCADVAVLAVHDGTAACPGYQASNVKTQHGAVVGADLTLAGTACNVYGTDLDNLKLEIEYQTGRMQGLMRLLLCSRH